MDRNKKLYYWTGLSLKGEKARGVIETTSLALAKTELCKQGIINRKISKKANLPFTNRITQSNLTTFYRQLVIMIKAGIPLHQALALVNHNQTNLHMKNLIATLKKDVETGLNFSEALSKHPRFFSQLICNLISTGEKSGRLETMLEQIASYKEKIEINKKKIKKALTYPLVVLFISYLVILALLTLVIPQFELIFKSFGSELPALTLLIIHLSTFFKSYWLLFLSLLLGLAYSWMLAQRKLVWFSETLDRIYLKLPLVGTILVNTLLARFSRTLAITFAAGLPLVEALAALSGVMNNSVYTKAIFEIKETVSTGLQLQMAIRNTLLFPNIVIQMIAIGEESGTLETMLTKIADFYEEEVNNAIDTLTTLLEPFIMAILGIIIGGLVLAMYLPIFKLGSVS